VTQDSKTKNLSNDELLSLAIRLNPATGKELFSDAELTAYRHQQLPESEVADFERALAKNPRNWKRLEELAEAEEVPEAEEVRSRGPSWQPWWGIAAALLVTLTALFAYSSGRLEIEPIAGEESGYLDETWKSLQLVEDPDDPADWMFEGSSIARVELRAKLLRYDDSADFAVYREGMAGAIGIRTMRTADNPLEASLVGSLGELAGLQKTSGHEIKHEGNYTVRVVALSDPPKYLLFPQLRNSLRFDFRIVNPDESTTDG